MKKSITSLFVITLFVALTGVAQATPVTAPSVPDAGSTASLIAIGVGALAMIRRYVS
ncbi:MAG: VPDSG-CTERM sorting domain-containing protein [Verrucomicrobiota bacterium]